MGREIVEKKFDDLFNSTHALKRNLYSLSDILVKEISSLEEDVAKYNDESMSMESEILYFRDKLSDLDRKLDTAETIDRTLIDDYTYIKSRYLIKQDRKEFLNTLISILYKRIRFKKNLLLTLDSAQKEASMITEFIDENYENVSVDVNSNSDMHYAMGIATLEAQERERKRISREIHDGPAQHIANLVMRAEIAEQLLKTDVKAGVQEIGELKRDVNKALDEVRGIIFNLRPMLIDDLGLNETMRNFLKKVSETASYELTYDIEKVVVPIDEVIQLSIFRMTQEILNNIRKHGKATNVMFKLRYGTRFLEVTITDDGIGYDFNEKIRIAKLKGESYGLLGINERIKQFGGEFNVLKRDGLNLHRIKMPVTKKGGEQ